jgi:hypothetical protein
MKGLLMKLSWMVAVLLVACLSVSGEVSKDQFKDLKRLVQIEGVRDYEEEHQGGKRHKLRVEFSSEAEGMKEIRVRVAVELTDKKTKQAYLVKQTGRFADMLDVHEGEYEGEGYWELYMPYGDFDKLKITAYVVQFGVMDGDTFVPFQTECDDVKSYDELIDRTANEFPNSCRLLMTLTVSR